MNNNTTEDTLTHSWTLATNMPGYLPNGDSAEPFDATIDEAIDALLDEAVWQVGDDMIDPDDEDDVIGSDLALIAQYRRGEGRDDLRFNLTRNGEASIYLESYANGFGGTVRLIRA